MKGNLKKFQEVAILNDIPIRHEIPIIEEGWVGKPKRMFQILYERGFLDLTKLNLYTV